MTAKEKDVLFRGIVEPWQFGLSAEDLVPLYIYIRAVFAISGLKLPINAIIASITA